MAKDQNRFEATPPLRDWGRKHSLRIRDADGPARSPAERLMTAFDATLTARTVAEGLHCCEVGDSADQVLEQMSELGFDVLGVRLESGANVGYVERGELGSGVCGDYVIPFLAAHLISDSAPLFEVMSVLESSPRIFVLGGPSVFGIITRGDLQKEPVRVFVFALVTMLEMQISAILRRGYADDAWIQHLSAGRLERANKIFEARVSRNEQIDLFDCLQLCDKRDLIAREEKLREALGFRSKRECTAELKAIEELRDRVAHAQDLIAGTDWPCVIRIVEGMDLLLQRAALSKPSL